MRAQGVEIGAGLSVSWHSFDASEHDTLTFIFFPRVLPTTHPSDLLKNNPTTLVRSVRSRTSRRLMPQ
jgi:hypothetical protein